jgi:hypothetical protein
MVPTNLDKIEHFLSAYLGLTDERKWLVKVDMKLKKSRLAIQQAATRK